MSEIFNIKTLTPRLQKMLSAYGIAPERNPQAAQRTRKKFMKDLDAIFVDTPAPKPQPGWAIALSWLSALIQRTGGFAHFMGKRAVAFIVIAVLVFGVFLSGGVGITAYAASASLPGDITFPLKMTFENTQAYFTPNYVERSRLYLDFAGRRLTEIQSLIDQGRYADIARAEDEFEKDIRNALKAVEYLSRTDPSQATKMNVEITSVLLRYSNILTQMLTNAPSDVQPILQNAIDASKSAAGDGAEDDDGDPNSISPVPTPSIPLATTPTPDSPVTPGRNGGSNDNDDDSNGNNRDGNNNDVDGGGDDEDDDRGDDDDDDDDDDDGDD